ncbi:DUF2442 domain-containing protein [bacterium]|nr:DUF2442 domain-containing protein [bacterium]NUM77060.1 DUF2442 domain-containing protein [candidate division KSB1 bacterium]RIK78634.1 MAG: DUF2442 domain-containing protein [candidate division KSB1 bacterium]
MSKIKITYEPALETEIIEIVQAEYLDGYRLKIWFNNGKKRIIDFEPFLRSARNPLFKKYLHLKEFKKFSIVYGNLDWNDYEMCFPVSDLYEGKI